MARIIAIINQKGGVAKTTTAHNLAVALCELKQKVLLIDGDPQANLTVGLSINLTEVTSSLADVLQKKECLLAEVIVETEVPGLDLVPATKAMIGIEEDLFKRLNRESLLQKKITDDLRQYYDFIIIDSPPNFGIISNNILVASEELIIPVASEFYSLQGLAALVEQVALIREEINPELTILGLLLTRVKRTNFSKQIAEELQGFQLPIFATKISESVKISEAPAFGKSVLEHDPKGDSSKQYRDFALEIMQKV